MQDKRETPEPWQGAFDRAEISSLNQLAERTGIAVQTLVRLVHGQGSPSNRTLDRVAAVLRPADARRVGDWAGRPWAASRRELPDQARELTDRQWDAVLATIRAMADPGAVGRQRLRSVPDEPETVPEAAMEKEPRGQRRKRERPGQSTDPYIDS